MSFSRTYQSAEGTGYSGQCGLSQRDMPATVTRSMSLLHWPPKPQISGQALSWEANLKSRERCGCAPGHADLLPSRAILLTAVAQDDPGSRADLTMADAVPLALPMAIGAITPTYKRKEGESEVRCETKAEGHASKAEPCTAASNNCCC